jgi:hypothetical protein
MRMPRSTRRAGPAALVATLAAWLALVPFAPAAAGSCATTPTVADSVLFGDIVFVGSVVGLSNDGRWATVQVEERWRGAAGLAGTVEVHGGPEAGASTSNDRVYRATRYLFVVTAGNGFLVDDACSGTTAWTADLASYRPTTVSPDPEVVAGSQVTLIDAGAVALVAALLLALLVAIVAYLVILRARRRPPDWVR